MRKSIKLILAAVLVCFAIMAINSSPVLADDAVELETLKKVNQIKRILKQKVLPRSGSVPKTGQILCYPEGVGGPIPCEGTGQDGDLQKGTPWPIPRFTENDNGTITDNMTGLVWLESANCFTTATWTNALATCNTLEDGQCGLTDGSSVGDWRLPNIREMLSLIDYAYRYPALSNTEGTDQWTQGNAFTWAGGAFPSYPAQVGYWTSTTKRGNGEHAWYVHLESGQVGYGHKWEPDEISFWPVRNLRPDER